MTSVAQKKKKLYHCVNLDPRMNPNITDVVSRLIGDANITSVQISDSLESYEGSIDNHLIYCQFVHL
jgi:ABC-type uncharacterized transport system ATPase component